MKTVWANHVHEDSIRFEGFCGSEIEAKWKDGQDRRYTATSRRVK